MDIKQIKSLMQEFDSSSLSKLKITSDNFSIKLEKNTGVVAPVVTPVAPVQIATPIATVASESVAVSSPVVSGDVILSPMVGTFYASPSPDSPAFVKKGDKVKKGQVLCILEAMKIMNELEAEFDCEIVDVLVSDAQSVEYDMPLFSVKKL